jgi:hypothetical protein
MCRPVHPDGGEWLYIGVVAILSDCRCRVVDVLVKEMWRRVVVNEEGTAISHKQTNVTNIFPSANFELSRNLG